MQPDDLDRLLGEEGSISPSTKFSTSVMSSVLREAETPRSIGFPWKPVLFGITSAALAFGAGGGRLASEASVPTLADRAELFTGWLESLTAHISAAAANPTASALALTLLVGLVPIAVYEGYQHMRSTYP